MNTALSNHNSVEQIWYQFSGKLKSFIVSKVKDNALADDLLQEVFIKIHRLIGQLRDENKLQAWVYQVTRNTVYDYLRRPGQKIDLNVEAVEIIEEDSDNEYMSETIEDMVKMMDEMPSEYCDVLCLTELGGMSHKEYAEKTGISLTAAKTRAFRARNMLKDLLMKCCHYQFDKYGTAINIQPAGCCCCCDESCN
jgi:RNA polymerase sigma-70 factor (ECF subfamily)